jgi:hypothetical protein
MDKENDTNFFHKNHTKRLKKCDYFFCPIEKTDRIKDRVKVDSHKSRIEK